MLCIVSVLGLRAQLTNGTVYWIQDAATGQFITRGGNWGTRAVTEDVGGVGFKAEFISDGVYKLQTVDRTLAGNAAYLGTGLYLDQNTQTEWKITASGVGYTISSGEQYLNISGKSNQQNQVSLVAAGEAAVWKFLTRTEYKEALAAKKNAEVVALAATMGLDGITTLSGLEAEIAGEDYVTVDQTSKLTNPNMDGDKDHNLDGWTKSDPGSPRGNGSVYGNGGTAQAWNGTIQLSQTVTGLPSGLYKITMLGLYRVHNANNANNVGLDNSSSTAYVYANGNKTEFASWLDYNSKPNNTTGAVSAFNNGDYVNTIYTYVGTDGKLELGIMSAGWNDNNWPVFGHFTLTQIYSIAMYKKAYDDAMTAATDAQTSLTGFSVYATQKSTLDAAITTNTLTGEDLSDVEKLTEAATNLNNAAAAVAAQVAACDQYASIVSTIGENTNVDLTSFVSNAGFELGNLNGWTSTSAGGIANNNNFSQKVGTYFVERWQANGESQQAKLSDGTLAHDAIILPAGLYQISATGQVQEQKNGAMGGGYFLYANSEKVEIGAPARYNTYVKLNDDKSELVIKFALESCTGNWISCDDVQLTYVGSDFPAVTLVEGKMSTAAATAQTSAKTAFDADKTATNYNALVTAIANAQASKDAYAKTSAALTAANTLKTNHTFASAAAVTTFSDAITATQTAYDNGTLTTAEANNANNLGTITYGWHAARAEANWTVSEAYMQNAWTDAEYNDWSVEGETDGSDFLVPFFQNWVADGSSLAEGTTSGTLTELPNGLYKVSALIRVRAKNGTAATDATGITMAVNGGTPVDVTEGTQVGETQFSLGTFEAEGLVKNGTLNVVITRADGNNVSWLSFKNVKYTKVRDLTPAEEAPATAEDYAALNTAIANAEDKTLGFDEGDYAPYNNITVLAALAAAKAINQEGDNAHDDVVAATNAIANSEWNANVEEVNAVYDGTFAAATNNGAPKGWTMSNNTLGGDYHSRAFVGDDRLSEFNGTKSGLFLRFDGTNSNRGSMYYYGNTENYTMPLKKDVTYYAKVDFTNWGTTSSKPLRMNVTGPEGFSATGLTVNSTKNADTGSDTPDQILFVFTANVAGNYTINFQCPGSDDNKHNVLISNVELFRATPATMKITDAKYATFVAPFDVTIPADVTAYTIDDAEGNTLKMTEVSTTIKANTPVVLFKESALDATTFYGMPVAGEPTEGLLTGVYTETVATAGTYVLQKNDDLVGFYEVATGEEPTVGANRAYLKARTTGVKAFFFSDATAIKNVFDGVAAGNIYDLNGRKVSKMQKGGVYVVNGKKVLVK